MLKSKIAMLGVLALLIVGLTPHGGAVIGDEMPSGEHFTLNVLGKEKVGKGVGDKTGGSKLFVPLYGECRIDLSEGDFAVKDADCLDGRSAFQLPNPDPEQDGFSHYAVFVRALGKPGGSAVFTSCLEDDGEKWCSTESVFVARAAGQSPSYDVSREMLTICHDSDGDGDFERETIFEDSQKDYFWEYDNDGLRLAQLRFYPTITDISGPCPAV